MKGVELELHLLHAVPLQCFQLTHLWIKKCMIYYNMQLQWKVGGDIGGWADGKHKTLLILRTSGAAQHREQYRVAIEQYRVAV